MISELTLSSALDPAVFFACYIWLETPVTPSRPEIHVCLILQHLVWYLIHRRPGGGGGEIFKTFNNLQDQDTGYSEWPLVQRQLLVPRKKQEKGDGGRCLDFKMLVLLLCRYGMVNRSDDDCN